MIYPYPLFLHLLMAFFCGVILLYLIVTRRLFQNRTTRNYFNWFLCYFFYSLFLSIPLFFFKELMIELSFFYNLALLFLAIGMWFGLKVVMDFWNFNEKTKERLLQVFLIGVLIATALHFTFPNIPQPSEDGRWIFWYSNRAIGIFYSAFAFVVGYFWAFGFIRGIPYIDKTILRVRAFLLSVPGFVLPFSALFYFAPRNVLDIYLAFIAVMVGLLFFVAGSILVRFIRPSNLK